MDIVKLEEAFLLRSLQEVVKVWASGNGNADFNLKIENGTAELKLAFRLGHPGDAHVVPPQQHQQQPHHDHHQEPQLHRRRLRRKGAARREKDRARAARHQAGLRPKKSAGPADILLHFLGRILPLENAEVEATVPVAPTPSSTPPSAPTRANSAASAWTPKKASMKTTASPKYIDYNLVRKNLFPSQEPPNDPPPLAPVPEDLQSVTSKEFQRREDDLWARIFTKE